MVIRLLLIMDRQEGLKSMNPLFILTPALRLGLVIYKFFELSSKVHESFILSKPSLKAGISNLQVFQVKV